ncbi:unnamed protein product [Caenorhabditis auriculariae]|uniref:PUM-HD domain-containing protein n=1 Tax=Caenorhabditis auriculariae TaxID=2777116 RepID=A0A8S1H6P8_9PELO|nr:unnamed protein product [Caenorhabditis auriculariae]
MENNDINGAADLNASPTEFEHYLNGQAAGRFLYSSPGLFNSSPYSAAGSYPLNFNSSVDPNASFNQSLSGFLQFGQDSYSPQPLIKPAFGRNGTKSWARGTPETELRPKFGIPTFEDDSFVSLMSQASLNTSDIPSPASNMISRSASLPAWAVDDVGNIRSTVNLRSILIQDDIVAFASDKAGCHFLQKSYPDDADGSIRDEIFHKIVENKETFLAMCQNIFGNFFIQRVIECSRPSEQEIIKVHLSDDMSILCLDKCACRVVQIAIQKLDVNLASSLAGELRNSDLRVMCSDQNGNHVIQKIIKTLPISAWSFIVEFFCKDDQLISVCQDKYGCRVVQSTIEKLSDNPKSPCYSQRTRLLHGLMIGITKNCGQLSANEFANYVIQHIIKAGGVMEGYRNTIIEKCLLRNLLSMSQEKYASHVVEGAFLFAPPNLLREMMEEVFDGYVPHPDTNRDALDILLFHQFGNFVIQQMIHICCSAILGHKERKMDEGDLQMHRDWLERIKNRVAKNIVRLERFSSGKKIISALNKMDSNFWSMCQANAGLSDDSRDSSFSCGLKQAPSSLLYFGRA